MADVPQFILDQAAAAQGKKVEENEKVATHEHDVQILAADIAAEANSDHAAKQAHEDTLQAAGQLVASIKQYFGLA